MYPRDNIFSIYNMIGKRTPFLVKRCVPGLGSSSSEERMYDPNRDRTFLVETVEPKGKYGKAYGKCFFDGKADDSYRKKYYPDLIDEEIPCAGCGAWVLIDVPGVDLNDIFPPKKADYIMKSGKYKGKTIKEIYTIDAKYIYWQMDNNRYFKIDFHSLLNIPQDATNAEEIIKSERERIFPKSTVDDKITFGKYKGKTYREIFDIDPQYIDWLLHTDRKKGVDINSFISMINK